MKPNNSRQDHPNIDSPSHESLLELNLPQTLGISLKSCDLVLASVNTKFDVNFSFPVNLVRDPSANKLLIKKNPVEPPCLVLKKVRQSLQIKEEISGFFNLRFLSFLSSTLYYSLNPIKNLKISSPQ